ncbi:ATP-dependent zinc metalloprotease FtsH [Andreprevotia sp. IGB-42]|uniref:ATP-binding protein n=1 Tax=Andreprevotia sp. IGB-42 TaxID=2497473 RepID=UPI001359FB20|nr:ATP-binding protein [Andreprevotia sp. IGB-42]KAF0813711.1 ATP-dependent zinc metalloprotease FtsH [Andreprevotia sp. IGB-42]
MTITQDAIAAGLSEREAWQAYAADCLARVADAVAPGDGRLRELAALFGLDELETDTLAMLWVASFAPQLRAELVQADPWVLQLTMLVASRVFGHPQRVRLASESPLRTWRLLTEHETGDGNAVLQLDPQLLAWLEGEAELDRTLIGRVQMHEAGLVLPAWPVDAVAAQLRAGLPEGVRWRVRIQTEDLPAARDFAAAVAARLALPLLLVLPGALAGDDGDKAIRIQRQAFLDRGAPLFEGPDANAAMAPVLQSGLPLFPVQFVIGTAALPALPGVRDLQLSLPAPDAEARRALWLRALPEAAAWPQGQLDDLAARYDVGIANIQQAAATAPRDAAEAGLRVREGIRDDLGGLAQRIDCTFGWNDLVVPEAVRNRLEDIAFEARERNRLWAEPEARRLYPHGRGLAALFAGPPGTGKTMAAQVIAAELGLDLLRIDLSAVLSKWVGETAQNLQKILSAKVSRHSVLFFDEADALYGKRVEEVRDAQDRFANMDISHLMVALESFDGVVLMATNLKANIDPAFIRRIRHVVEFSRPDEAARLAIWQRTLTALFGAGQVKTLKAALQRLAAVESTGAQIKSAALSALFAARRAGASPTLALLADALARELAKDGNGLSARELIALVGR